MTTEVHYRAFASDIELRKGGDGRTVFGIVVPYGRPTSNTPEYGLIEQFRMGAFANQVRAPNRIPFARDHLPLGGTLIGTTKVLREDTTGLYGEFRVARTAAGDEALALIEDGALPDFSIGFRDGRNGRLPGGVTERITATLTEVAVLMEGAYGLVGANVGGVRSAGPGVVHMQPHEPPAATPNLDAARKLLEALPPLR